MHGDAPANLKFPNPKSFTPKTHPVH